MRDLTRGPLAGHIVAMAIPIAVGMAVQTLYYLVDLYFVSRLGGTALAGVSAAGNAMFLIMALTQALSVGTLSLVAQAVGRKDRERANLVFNQAVFLALALAAAVLAGGYLGLAEAYIGAIGADPATIDAGLTYLHWFLPGMALHFGTAAMSAALQGTGIVKPTMVVQMISVLANAVLTPVLVAGWVTGMPLGVVGAALASSTAAAIGLGLMTVYYLRLERYVAITPRLWRPRFALLRRMLAVGLPAGGEFALLFVYLAVIYTVIRTFGAEAQAGFGVGTRVMQAVFLPGMAIAFAVPAVAGQNFGARDAARVQGTFRTAAVLNVAIMLTLTLLCQVRPEWLVAPFATDPEVRRVAAVFLTVISWNFVFSGLIFTSSGIFQGLGNTLPALASSASRLLTFVVPAFWLASRSGFRIEHIWYLSVASVSFQALLSLILVRWQMRRRLDFAPPFGSAQASS